MTYKTIVVDAPTVEPVTLEEACRQLKIDSGYDDEHVLMLISIARDKAEKYCNRFFSTQTVKIVFDAGFSGGSLFLPFPDLDSVDSIEYIDSENTLQTVSDVDYTFYSDIQTVFHSDTFPSDAKSIIVTVTTAPPVEYGGAKIGMLMLITDLYELRTESVIAFSVANNPAVSNSLWPYRVNLGV